MTFDHIRIVLVNPSHPGNIGATARAMKNMGLSHLYLVQPEHFPCSSEMARAAGADEILAQARVVEDLTAALSGCHFIFGTSARTRALPLPICNPRECAEYIVKNSQQNVAIIFGREKDGLSNEELAHCHRQVYIPSDPLFSSLNLAQAVQIIAYEIRMASMTGPSDLLIKPSAQDELATAEEVAGFHQHLHNVLVDLKFLDPKQPKTLLQRLQRLFNRIQLEKKEINILRGILTAVERRIRGQN